MSAHIIPLDRCDGDCADRVGGKAVGLGRLLGHGFEVPPGFAVTTDAYREFLAATGLAAEIDRELEGAGDIAGQQRASERIRGLFEEASPAEAVSAEIGRAYAALGELEAAPVAVRSSATAEDGAEASFAGQQETYLWIRTPELVTRHVLRCWGSLFTPQAIAYRAHLGIPSRDVAMGVVVQSMVAAEVAGVMITIDPVTGDRSQISLEASYGLGLAVVGGEVTPDRFAVDKVTLEIRSRAVGEKAVAYRFDPAAGEVRLAEVAEAERSVPCVTDEEVIRVATMGKRIERELGGTQDVEWALGPGPEGAHQLFLLQTRPETVWSKRAPAPIAAPGADLMSRVLGVIMRPNG
jgi:pyruvate,water dikinase